jgi:hypothetical protein
MPTSKHSNSGRVPVSCITSRKSCTLAGGLSNSIGGQAQPVGAHLEVVERARVAGRHLGPGGAQAVQRALVVGADHAGGLVDDQARAGLAHGLGAGQGHGRVPARQVAAARRLVAEVHVHHRGAGVIGAARLGGQLGRADRHGVLARVGQHAGDGTGDDGFSGLLTEVSVSGKRRRLVRA